MADFGKNFKKCKAMIRDNDTSELLADTEVTDHDVGKNIITLGTDHLSKAGITKVTVVVFAPKCMYEYSGTIRKEQPGFGIEIAIYGEKQKNERGYRRYDMQAQGRVESIVLECFRIKFNRPIPVEVKNISANGMMFNAAENEFSIGDIVVIRFGGGNNEFVNEYEIVRTQAAEPGYLGYGCRMLMAEEQQKYISPVVLPGDLNKSTSSNFADIYMSRQTQLEKQYGYYRLLELMENFYNIMQTTLATEHFLIFDDPFAEEGKALETITETIFRYISKCREDFLLNCIHHRFDNEKKSIRHLLNTALLAASLGKWRNMEPDIIKSMIKSSLFVGQPDAQRLFSDGKVLNMVTAADIYDMRASHLNGVIAAVPLVFIEQSCASGAGEPAESVRGAGRILAENILRLLYKSMVFLADGGKARVMYIPSNDIGHPLLQSKEFVWQESSQWAVLGFVIDENKAAEG